MKHAPHHLFEPLEDGRTPVPGADRRRRFGALGRELLIVLAVKAAVLFAIWWAWFSAPQAEHMRMAPERVQQRLVEAAAVQPQGVRQPPPAGADNHAAR